MRRKIIAGSLVAVVAAAVAAGVPILNRHADQPRTPRVIIAKSDQLLPSESLADWRSFADHLAVVTLTGERRLAPTPEEVAAGEGYIPRVVTLRIDSLLWSRPAAPAAPAAFDIDLDGWSFKGATETPLRLEGEPMMTVGNQYVMPIVDLVPDATVQVGGWSPLAPESIIPYAGGVLGRGDVVQGGGPSATDTLRAQFDGQAPSALRGALERAAPYPAVAGAMNLPPDQRAKLVSG